MFTFVIGVRLLLTFAIVDMLLFVVVIADKFEFTFVTAEIFELRLLMLLAFEWTPDIADDIPESVVSSVDKAANVSIDVVSGPSSKDVPAELYLIILPEFSVVVP